MTKKEKKRLRLFTVDGNWYLHRAYHTMRSTRPIEEALPYALTAMICKDAIRVKADLLLVAFDGGNIFRYKVYPKYKEGRDLKKAKDKALATPGTDRTEAQEDSVYQYLPAIFDYFNHLGIAFFQPDKYEADDVLCSLAHHAGDDYRFIGGTRDKDAFQWLSEHAVMFDSNNKDKAGKPKPRYITAEKAERMKGVPIHHMIEYQTLIGDSGDSIPGIPKIGPMTAKARLAEHGSIRNWFISTKKGSKSTDKAVSKKAKAERKLLIVNQEALLRNRKLVTLCTDVLPPQGLENLKMEKKKVRREVPRPYFEYQNFLYPTTNRLFG